MLTDAARSTMLGLVQGACHVVTPSRYSVSGSRCGIAYYDTSRDEPITEVTEFAGAVAALQADPVIAAIYGSENVQRLAIQFVYNTCGLLDDGIDILAAFEATWNALVTESSQPHWRFAAVANLSNFSFAGDIADLGHGVSIQGRSFDRLSKRSGSIKWTWTSSPKIGQPAGQRVLTCLSSKPANRRHRLTSSLPRMGSPIRAPRERSWQCA